MAMAIYTRSAAAYEHGEGTRAHASRPEAAPAAVSRSRVAGRLQPRPGMWMVVQRMVAGLGRWLRPNRRRLRPRPARR
jgi:hypothetical protein